MSEPDRPAAAPSGPPDEGVCPLLEYDPDPSDVVTTALAAASTSPRAAVAPRAVFAFLGGTTQRWAQEHGFERVTSVKLLNQRCPVFVGQHPGKHPDGHPRKQTDGHPGGQTGESGDTAVTLVEMPLGAPAAAIVADDLFRLGVCVAVAVGSCGGLVHLDEGGFVLPTRALRDEGTSWHYAPPTRWIATDPDVRAAIAAACDEAGYPAVAAPTWTTDALFRETAAKVATRRAEGCLVVEMECAALAAVARHRGARFAQLLFTADTLAGGTHDVRGMGRSVHAIALGIALDAAVAAPLDGECARQPSA
ncbi:MAG: nucleoside phosphorylase [Austwickia sp.]|nr:nucleoside phosphorylase [Actinomycetota bacterium]MCO5310486.1 nucleoside phosphorylase [Austwickia sp.]